jgi:hypothetical protein
VGDAPLPEHGPPAGRRDRIGAGRRVTPAWGLPAGPPRRNLRKILDGTILGAVAIEHESH